MAFLGLFGDSNVRRTDIPLPRTSYNQDAGQGYYGDTLSTQNAYRDTDRYAMGLVPEPIHGDSMTQWLQSMQNWGGLTGMNQYGTAGGAVGNAMDYYSRILNAQTPTAIMGAMQPEVTAANNMFQQQRRQIDQYGRPGGGRAAAMGELPFQQAGAISQILAQARPQAALQLGALGTNQQRTALDLINAMLQGQLTMRGQNVQETGQNKALAGSLVSSLAPPFSGGFLRGLGSVAGSRTPSPNV